MFSFLDEIAQFGKGLLDALRQPLEDGHVTISRARYKVDYPAHFMLVVLTVTTSAAISVI